MRNLSDQKSNQINKIIFSVYSELNLNPRTLIQIIYYHLTSTYLRMAGKKKIQKQPKGKVSKSKESQEDSPPQSIPDVEPVVESEPKATKQKKGKSKAGESSSTINLFSPEFNNKVDNFNHFYEEFLNLRGGDTDPKDEQAEVTARVAKKLEGACSGILKADLQDAERWIEEQQQNIQKQIDSTKAALNTTRISLGSAGTFSSEEIENNLSGIKQKGEKLQKIFDDFGVLKAKANDIYSSKMDEE